MNLLETTYLVLLESKHYCIFFMSVFNPVADSANDDPDHYTFIFLVADSGLRKVERGVGRNFQKCYIIYNTFIRIFI